MPCLFPVTVWLARVAERVGCLGFYDWQAKYKNVLYWPGGLRLFCWDFQIKMDSWNSLLLFIFSAGLMA